MTFLQFQKAFQNFPIIPVGEVEKHFPGFDPNALTRWQKAGYVEKLRNGYYRLSGRDHSGEADLFFIANRLYMPSYVSLHSALSWYGFIPEGVFTVTSVSTLKTQAFTTPAGRFSYRSLKPGLFWGYQLESFGSFRFKIADPEKALLDFFYLFPEYDSEDAFFELRLNSWEIFEKVDGAKLECYTKAVRSTTLEQRIKKLMKFLRSYDTFQ